MKNALRKLDGADLNGRKLRLTEERGGSSGGGYSRYRRYVWHSFGREVQVLFICRCSGMLTVFMTEYSSFLSPVTPVPGPVLVIAAGPDLVPGPVPAVETGTGAARGPSLLETRGGRGAAAGLAPGSGPGTALSRDALAPVAGLPTAKEGTRSRMHTPVPTADPAARLLETSDRGPPPRTKREALRLVIRSYVLTAPPLPRAAMRTN